MGKVLIILINFTTKPQSAEEESLLGKLTGMVNNNILGLILVFICTILNTGGQFLMKKGVSIFSLATLPTNYYLILGFFLYGISALFLIIALKFGELSVIYPVISVTFIWVTLISRFVLKEVIILKQYFGVTFILLGVFLITRGGKK